MDRPHLSVNFAVSLDGKITSVGHRPSGWTSADDLARLKALRQDADALLVGRGTLEADRMTLTAPQNPLRCVVSRSGRFDPSHPLFHTPGGPIHLLGTRESPTGIPGTIAHRGPLLDFIENLHRLGVRRLHCEGGGSLVRELAELDLVDEIHLTWAAHTVFGGREAPGLLGPPGDFLPASRSYELVHFEPHPHLAEAFLTYRRTR